MIIQNFFWLDDPVKYRQRCNKKIFKTNGHLSFVWNEKYNRYQCRYCNKILDIIDNKEHHVIENCTLDGGIFWKKSEFKCRDMLIKDILL